MRMAELFAAHSDYSVAAKCLDVAAVFGTAAAVLSMFRAYLVTHISFQTSRLYW
jgi:hypothetical protein